MSSLPAGAPSPGRSRLELAGGWRALARAAAVMIVFWTPFPGAARGPSLLLALVGGGLLARDRGAVLRDPSARRLGVLFLLLLLPILGSALPGSYSPAAALTIAGVLVLFYPAGLAILAAARGEGRAASPGLWPRRLQTWLALVVLLWLVDALVQWVAGQDLIGVKPGADGRLVGFFEGRLWFAMMFATLLPIALWWLLPRRPLLSLAVFVAAALVILLTGTRSAWVMLVVLTPFYLWHLPLPGKRWLVGVAVPLAAVLALGSPLVQGKVRSLLAVQSLDFAGIDAALSGRLYIWDVGLRMLADRPLTGVGAGSFERAYQDYSHRPNDPFRRDGGHAQVYHAHQLYVAVAAETGLPGLLGLIAIWVLLVRWYRRAPPQRRDAARPYAMALFLAAFPLNSQTLLYRPWWFPVLLLLTALLLVCLEGESESAGAAGPSTPAARPAGSP